VAREARLEAELDEKKREIGFLKERITIETLGRINAELKLKKLRKKKLVRSDDGFGDCEIVVKREKCNVEGGGEVEGGKVEALGRKERRVAELESEKEMKVYEEKKEVVGINGSMSLKRDEGGLGASGMDFFCLAFFSSLAIWLWLIECLLREKRKKKFQFSF